MSLNGDIKRAVRAQVRSAGPRYTPQIEEGAPNIQIENLMKPLSSLSFDAGFREEITKIKDELSKESANLGKRISRTFARRVRTPAALIALLEKIAVSSLNDVSKVLREADIVAKQCQKSLSKASSKIWDELYEIRRANDGQDELTRRLDKKKQGLEDAHQEIRRLQSCIGEAVEFLRSPSRRLLDDNICFIEGGWGTGKTHTLCDLALVRLENSQPVYFALGKNIYGPSELARGIVNDLDNAALFELLNERGKVNGERSLVIVDGINEGDKEKWHNEIADLLSLAKKHPYVGLVLSIRSPFQNLCVPVAIYLSHTRLIHHGFEESEFDAQKEFFHFYELNLPEVPILRDEFSRPLVLKIVCEQLADMTAIKARRNFLGITSGQVGMTFIFEGFVKKIGKRLEDAHGLQRHFCWKIIKEFRVDAATVLGVAKSMAEQSTDYIHYHDAVELFVSSGQFDSRQAAKDFLRVMVNEGLLIEGIHYTGYGEDAVREEIIQLPYQKFSDHIIARWLLKNHLDTSSISTIRRCFYSNRPLGKVFNLDENAWEKEYAEPGLAEALMIEFPTRLGGEEYDNKRELIFYLPKGKRLISSSVTPFLEGLYWRHPIGIGADTGAIICQLLETDKENITDNTFDALMVLALKPQHPLGSRRFSNYLLDMDMPDRDMFWGEYLRKAYEEQSPWRLIEWVTKAKCANIPPDYIPGLLKVLSWLLVSVDRYLRDMATQALVLIGQEFPRFLFKCCIGLFHVNDPYVSERLLAACYGVAMLKWHGASDKFKADLGIFARILYKKLFRENADHATNHVLVRDYAVGIIAIAHKIGPYEFDSAQIKNMDRPFRTIPDIFPDHTEIDDEICERVQSAIHMDFGNYTIGRLIDGRANYDANHPEYQAVLKKIHWRMADLGYDVDRFKSVERREYYGRQGNEEYKIDRYGKKYSWIAFFEMFGWRQANGLLSDHRQNERTSDCDLDPTFISTPEYENIPLPYLYSASMEIADWLENFEFPDLAQNLCVNHSDKNWLLLDAYIKSDCETDDRSFWLDVRAFIVEDRDIETFVKAFSPDVRLDEYTSLPEFYYTYFGETPWRSNVSGGLFQPCPSPNAIQHFTRNEYVVDEDADPIFVPEIRINDRVYRVEEYRQPGEWRESGGVECIRMVSHYTWESYHSRCNDVSGVPFLNTRITNQLNLGMRSRAPDLYDVQGNVAVKVRKIDFFAQYPSSKCLLLRSDLVDQLADEDKSIILMAVGMKDIKIDSSYRAGDYDIPSYPENICEIITKNKNQIRQLYIYKNGNIRKLDTINN